MLSRGSEWRRWEPHIHAPGTVMNNQYKGPAAWDDYLSALEAATPTTQAIAVTDYYILDTYLEVLKRKAAGRLPDAKLVFPNVELRLDVATAKGGFVNLHLFVSPEDPDHVGELQRLLTRLQFNVLQDRFDCTRADLIRLGKKVDSSITDDKAALAYGANQFKVNFGQLKEVFGESAWAKQNILVAVAGGASDGTSGVRGAADQTIRREIEGFAHVIFASSAVQRAFWLGQNDLSPDEIRARYRGLKPCLHGSDAHKLDDVATPFGERFSWIKGDLEFDSLRQACIDPGGRAFVGAEPPSSGPLVVEHERGPLLLRHAAVGMPGLSLSKRLRRLVTPKVLHFILQGEKCLTLVGELPQLRLDLVGGARKLGVALCLLLTAFGNKLGAVRRIGIDELLFLGDLSLV
jgi:hypothetical protein